MLRQRWWLGALAAVALVLLLGRALADAFVDYQWYEAMGAAALWRARMVYTTVLELSSGFVYAAFALANLYAVRRSVVSLRYPRHVGNLEIDEEVPPRYLDSLAVILSLTLGALLALPTEQWTSLALARTGLPFRESDPYFGADLGFFVYWLPFESTLHLWTIAAVLVIAAVVILLYALTPSLKWQRGSLYVSNYVRRHLVILGAVMLLLLAWKYRLDAYELLLSGSGRDGALTYADHRATIPGNLLLSLLTVAAAAAVLIFGWQGQLRAAIGAVIAVFVISFAVRQVAPVLSERSAAARSAAEREQPYLATRAEYTRRAYAVDRVRPADSTVVWASLSAGQSFVSVWDSDALARAITRVHRNDIIAAGIGWSVGPRGLVAVLPERLTVTADPDAARGAWSVSRVLASVADSQGDPIRTGPPGTVERLPPVLVQDSIAGYIVLSDTLMATPAPALRGTLTRLAYAWSLQNFSLLYGDLPASARIMTRRGVRERVSSLAPFFELGSAITPAVAADSLFWSVDLYSTSDSYPLSQRIAMGAGDRTFDRTYFQHAATAIVNAHTGRVSLVADARHEPIAESWMRAFPELFTRPSGVASGVIASLPPAVDAARAHATVVARLGMRGEAPRGGHLAWNEGADTLLTRGPAPMMGLPGPEGGLASTLPILDDNDRVAGLLIATRRGDPVSYWMPAVRSGVRWTLVIDTFRRLSDSTLSLPRGMRSVRGRIRAVPIAGEVTYVQPTFAWPPDAGPSLARVAVMRPDRVLTARTLAEVVGGQPAARDSGTATLPLFRGRVQSLYDQMRAALARSDWAAFGRAYDSLGAVLARQPR